MTILLHCADLMYASRITSVTSVTTEIEDDVRVVPDTGALEASLAKHDDVRIVLIDLQLAGDHLVELAQKIRERFANAKLIGFGPHVQKERLTAAKQAGLNDVVTRGQLVQQTTQILR